MSSRSYIDFGRRLWEKRPPLQRTGFRSGCLNCGPNPRRLVLRTRLAVGFGMVAVKRDGAMVWCGDDERVLLRRFELRARNDPNHDWRVSFDGPLSSTTYQRHERNTWVLIERGMGFA